MHDVTKYLIFIPRPRLTMYASRQLHLTISSLDIQYQSNVLTHFVIQRNENVSKLLSFTVC